MFNDEIKHAIVSHEAMVPTVESVKDRNIVGVWKIEDLYECTNK